jgi:hypothetical protein
VPLTVILTCTTATVQFILQYETIALNKSWSTTIITVSAIIRIFLKIVVISGFLTTILVEFCHAILCFMPDCTTISTFSFKLTTKKCYLVIIVIFTLFILFFIQSFEKKSSRISLTVNGLDLSVTLFSIIASCKS